MAEYTEEKLGLVTEIIKKIIKDSADLAEEAKKAGKTYRLRFGVAPRLNPEARSIFRGAFEDETLSAFCNRMNEEGKLLKDFVGYKPNLNDAKQIDEKNNFIHYEINKNDKKIIVKVDKNTGFAMTPIYYLEEFTPDWIKKKIMQKSIAKLAQQMGQNWFNANVKHKPTETAKSEDVL